MIKSINWNQYEIIRDIISLHTGAIEVDVCYSKGGFYKDKKIPIKEPIYKFDINPQTSDTMQANANKLPFVDGQISSIIYDPPFIVGDPIANKKNIMIKRYSAYISIDAMWTWYSECLAEFYRVLKEKGFLIVKCQDTINSGKQYISHVHIINEAEKLGFYCKDIFIQLAKNRINRPDWVQQHARKHHCYWIVFQKKKIK